MTDNIVVKTNRLNSVVQNLSLAEIRLIQLAIVDARETCTGLSADKPLVISALRFAEVFNLSAENAYTRLKNAEETLFNRRFSFIDTDGDIVKSRWIQRVKYKAQQGAIEIIFTHDVVNEITRLDGKQKEQLFNKYAIENTSSFNSSYSVRLYELLTQWKTAKKTPLFELQTFRGQLGLDINDYKAMGDFKKRTLDIAVKEINEKSDLTVAYTQEKRGRTIIGFKFTVKVKKTKEQKAVTPLKDQDTIDLFTGLTPKEERFEKGLTVKQINKIAIFKKDFITMNNHLISKTDRRSYDEIFEEYKPKLKSKDTVNDFIGLRELLGKNSKATEQQELPTPKKTKAELELEQAIQAQKAELERLQDQHLLTRFEILTEPEQENILNQIEQNMQDKRNIFKLQATRKDGTSSYKSFDFFIAELRRITF